MLIINHFAKVRRAGFICFYVMYCVRYLYYLLMERSFDKAYRRMPEEKEAYAREFEPLTPDEMAELGISLKVEPQRRRAATHFKRRVTEKRTYLNTKTKSTNQHKKAKRK